MGRLVTYFYQSGLEKDKLWSLIKEFKVEYIIDNINILKARSCMQEITDSSDATVLVSNEYIDRYVRMMKEKLQIKETIEAPNIGKENLEALEMSGQMFIYLNLCPKYMFEWTQLFVRLFESSSPDKIIQTLNRIIKIGTSKKNAIVVNVAKKIYENVKSKLSLKILDDIRQLNRNNPNDINIGNK